MVQADVKEYSGETQERARQELIAQGCLPLEGVKFDFAHQCKIPTLYAWLIDGYKMRQQVRIARNDIH